MMRPADTLPWRPLGRTGVHYWLVQRMAKRCGADPAEAAADGQMNQDDWVNMIQTCRHCTWTDGCQKLLALIDEEGPSAPPRECLNADRLERLAEGHRNQ